MIRAKVYLSGVNTSIYKTVDYNQDGSYKATRDNVMQSYVFSFVSGNNDPNHENTKFWQYTPNGRVEMNSINPEVAKTLVIGKEYYLDFTEAPQQDTRP